MKEQTRVFQDICILWLYRTLVQTYRQRSIKADHTCVSKHVRTARCVMTQEYASLKERYDYQSKLFALPAAETQFAANKASFISSALKV